MNLRTNLSCAGAVLALAIVLVLSSCGGGGGGGPVTPGNPQPTTSVRDAVRPTADGVAFWASLYRSIDDTTPLKDGSEFEIHPGESINFSAKAHADLLQVDGSYKTEEATMIPGVKFIWAFRGLDEDNAGMTGTLQTSLSQVTIAYTDLPAGGRYDLSVRAEVAPQDLVNYVNQRLQQVRQASPPNNGSGGGDNDDVIWAGVGVLVGLLICPSDSAGVIMVSVPGTTPPPPATNHAPTINPTGPVSLEVGQQGTWALNATDEDGDVLIYKWQQPPVATSPTYSRLFDVQGTYWIFGEVSDGRGGIASHQWTVEVTGPPARVLDHVTIMPGTVTLTVGDTQQFIAKSYDGDGVEITSGVTYAWTLAASMDGSINATGLYTAAGTTGTYSNAVKVTATYNGVEKVAYANVTIEGNQPPPGDQTLVAFPAAETLELGESEQFQFWLKDVQSGSLIRQLDNLTELTSWTISPVVAGEEYVTLVPGTAKTWQDSGPPDYTVLTFMTPGIYTLTAHYGDLSVTIPLTVNFASGG